MTVADLLRLIASLFVALCAPAHMLARVTGLGRRQLAGFAHLLQRMKARGDFLAYAGEDEATIARRMDRAAWIARDPIAALKHMVRRHRGPLRARFGMVAPLSFFPAFLACAALRDEAHDAAPADTS